MRAPAKIIIADDDRDDQLLFREALERLYSGKFDIHAVYNGVELLSRLRSGDTDIPDIIVLDLNMPLKDGAATLREIRAEERYRSIPVFILSTSSRESDIRQCRQLGCSEYYIKPFHLKEYNRIITDMLHRTFQETT